MILRAAQLQSINHINGLLREDVVTPPKTEKSNRTIKMPQFLCDEMQEYLKVFYSPSDGDRIFPISKSYLHHEMDRG